MEMELTQSMGDYLKAISALGEMKEPVRVRDIARYMQVKMPSVTEALRSLSERGLVNHEKYGYVELTHQGQITVQRIHHRYRTILRFLMEVLDMDIETAEIDACNMEHSISAEMLDRLHKMVNSTRVYVEAG